MRTDLHPYKTKFEVIKMSKLQGDNFKTETSKDLNNYYNNVFLPTLIKLENEQIKKYHVGDFIIQCEKKNIIDRDGYKLKSLKIIGQEYIIRVYLDSEYEKGIALSVNSTENKEEANRIYKEKVQMCK
jgi:hypothetical protein